MKNFFLVVTFMLVFGEFQNVFAQYPIPSNNVSVRETSTDDSLKPVGCLNQTNYPESIFERLISNCLVSL